MKPTQEQAIAWALQVGLISNADCKTINDGFTETFVDGYLLEAAYAAAYEAGRKDENEACAKVCDDYAKQIALALNESLVLHCALIIRARREQ